MLIFAHIIWYEYILIVVCIKILIQIYLEINSYQHFEIWERLCIVQGSNVSYGSGLSPNFFWVHSWNKEIFSHSDSCSRLKIFIKNSWERERRQINLWDLEYFLKILVQTQGKQSWFSFSSGITRLTERNFIFIYGRTFCIVELEPIWGGCQETKIVTFVAFYVRTTIHTIAHSTELLVCRLSWLVWIEFWQSRTAPISLIQTFYHQDTPHLLDLSFTFCLRCT